uniref:Uncharacterized protein LOC114341132 n=1 Tax=Diabrotica virgifera virgifera TaxID=50390 RepID=A0A6P7GR44_DIAVI
MYSLKTQDNLNQGRFEVFEKKYKIKNSSEKVSKKSFKSFESSSLPPTKQTLKQQINRTIYISNIWCNAHLRYPTTLEPDDCGWVKLDNKYIHYWFDGPESPSISEITTDVDDINYSEESSDLDSSDDESEDGSESSESDS